MADVKNTVKNAANTVKTKGKEALENVKLKELASKLWGFAKANPGKAIGAGTLGAGNLAGLLDNEYWGGQAIGGTLGGLGSALFKANPYTGAMVSMGGGLLGSLFDKLRAKKAEEQAMAQRYGGAY